MGNLKSILFLAACMISIGDIFGQSADAQMPSKFKILVEQTDQLITLTCETGCAWKQISFSTKSNDEQVVDQYGFTSLLRDVSEYDPAIPNFLFTINKDNGGFKFGGKQGTNWTKLFFSCEKNNCHQYIDQNGMK